MSKELIMLVHTSTDPNQLEEIYRTHSTDSKIRIGLASNIHTPVTILLALQENDEKLQMTRKLIQNPSFPKEQFPSIIRKAMKLQKNKFAIDTLGIIANRKDLSTEVYEQLAQTNRKRVLINLASNPKTPRHIYRSFLSSKDNDVIAHAASNILLGTVDNVFILLHNPNGRIASFTAENPLITEEVFYDILQRQPNVRVGIALLFYRNHTPETLHALTEYVINSHKNKDKDCKYIEDYYSRVIYKDEISVKTLEKIFSYFVEMVNKSEWSEHNIQWGFTFYREESLSAGIHVYLKKLAEEPMTGGYRENQRQVIKAHYQKLVLSGEWEEMIINAVCEYTGSDKESFESVPVSWLEDMLLTSV